MGRLHAGADPSDYEPVTRSVRLHGMVTSIRLERRFWTILDEMSRQEKQPTAPFLCTLYDDVFECQGEVRNFASFLRVACALYLEQARAEAEAQQQAACAEVAGPRRIYRS